MDESFELETKVRKSGAGAEMGIVESGRTSRPFYVLSVPFLGLICKLFLFGFHWENKGWGLGALNVAKIYLPSLGVTKKGNKNNDPKKTMKVVFRDDNRGTAPDTPDSPVDNEGEETQTKTHGNV